MPVFGAFASWETLFTGSLGESVPGGEPEPGEAEEEACLGLTTKDFLLSSPKLERHLKIERKKKLR